MTAAADAARRVRADVADVLGVDIAGIGSDDNLLDLGMDTVRLMLLVQRWRDDGIDIDLTSLVEEPKLACWQELVAAGGRARAAPRPGAGRLTVVRVEQLSPRMVRITLGGADVAAFAGTAPGATALLHLPGRTVPRPVTARFHGGSAEIDVDVVVRDGGPLGRWAAAVRPPAEIVVSGPVDGSDPGTGDWLLFVVDHTAMAAGLHQIERLPAGSIAILVAVVADAAEEQLVQAVADLDVHWVHADAGAAIGPVLATVRAALPSSGTGSAWVAGEAGLVAAVAAILTDAKGVGLRVLAQTYWTLGRSLDDPNT